MPSKKSAHVIVMSKQELARLARPPGPLMSPLSADELEARNAEQREQMKKLLDGKGSKARREMKNTEHRAQRRLYQTEIPNAETRHPDLARWLRAVYAIPVYNANYSDPAQKKRAMINAKRMKDEGQKAGSPDNHVPVPRIISMPDDYRLITYGSLYLELKAESYPNDAQRERFPELAACGNAVVTVREPDEAKLAEKAILTIVRYLQGRSDFHAFGHPIFTYIDSTTSPKGE